MAEAINEMKAAAWHREVQAPYAHLCQLMGHEPLSDKAAFPKELRISSHYVRGLYMTDAALRTHSPNKLLLEPAGDNVLRIDWTEGAASRVGCKYLLNVMDGRGCILLTRPTSTSKPVEAKGAMGELFARGVRPKVAYVDDECCGAWPRVFRSLWPDAYVRLDPLHAIRRLTQTTSSTQHPWHGQFCEALAEAIYTDDAHVATRLRKALACEGWSGPAVRRLKAKYVPRYISDSPKIARAVETVIGSFREKMHREAGPLLTTATLKAWTNLKEHVLKDCLCDPPDCPIHAFTQAGATIGGEEFRRVRILRGTSPLEGFHAHQKQWLGTFARHTEEAGFALLSDGAARWNQKRHAEI